MNVVFAPNRPPESVAAPEPASVPQRGRRVIHPVATPDTGLAWRAVVHAADRDVVQTEWHLATCAAPQDRAAHCAEGQRLMETAGEPDGHCLHNGQCVRCEAQQHQAVS